MPIHRQQQVGASLIEVLVAMLLLSLGMLSLGAMLSFAVQMPKLSGYRANAVNLASGYVERIRANPKGFGNGHYDLPSSYALTELESSVCAYPDCDPATLATMDFDETKVAVRAELPAGGLFMERDGSSGNLWIMWQEPDTYAALDPSSPDHCPSAVADADPKPRCLYVRFKI
ncbi:MAG: type IV pilus modification protein PilV [Burkholderiaceae bacterium]